MKNNVYTSIVIALMDGLTIKNGKSSMLSNAKIEDVKEWSAWDTVMKSAYNTFFAYQNAKIAVSRGDKSVEAIKPVVDKAYDDLRTILTLIGDINGFKLLLCKDTLDLVSAKVVSNRKDLVGHASLLNSQIKNIKEQIQDNINANSENSMDNIVRLNAELDKLNKEYKAECCKEGSASAYKSQVSINIFRRDCETELALLIRDQSAKSYEDIKAERKTKNKAKAQKKADVKKAEQLEKAEKDRADAIEKAKAMPKAKSEPAPKSEPKIEPKSDTKTVKDIRVEFNPPYSPKYTGIKKAIANAENLIAQGKLDKFTKTETATEVIYTYNR